MSTPALYSHTTRSTGTTLTAAIYNADHTNHITNGTPSQLGGYSASTSEMQSATSPGAVSSESLASSLAGELERLRYVLKTLAGGAQWYPGTLLTASRLSGEAGTNTITANGEASCALTTDALFVLTPAVTNTGATTLNITPSGASALTAKNVFSGGVACVGGELVAGVPTVLSYDGTQFNILSAPGGVPGTSASTATFNGSGGTTGSVTRTWQKHGRMVILDIPAVTGTTGTNSSQLVFNTALPASVRPAVAHVAGCPTILNNAAGTDDPGQVFIDTSGVVTISRGNAGSNWTNTSTCGINNATTVVYFTG